MLRDSGTASSVQPFCLICCLSSGTTRINAEHLVKAGLVWLKNCQSMFVLSSLATSRAVQLVLAAAQGLLVAKTCWHTEAVLSVASLQRE